MLIVIEGVDASGKTTLAEDIANLADGQVIHKGPPTLPALVEYTAPLAHYTPDQTIICDRWHIGEEVYGPRYRAGSDLTAIEFQAVEMFLNRRHAILVHCDGAVSDILPRLRARGDQVDAKTLQEELTMFRWAVSLSELPTIVSRVGSEVSAREIIRLALRNEEKDVA